MYSYIEMLSNNLNTHSKINNLGLKNSSLNELKVKKNIKINRILSANQLLTTTDNIYNIGGTLYFNGSSITGGGGGGAGDLASLTINTDLNMLDTYNITNVIKIDASLGEFSNLTASSNITATGDLTAANIRGTLLTPLPITIQDGITKLGILGEALDMGTNDISNVGTITGTTGNFTNVLGTLLTPLPITIQDGITKLGILGEALDMGTNDISNVGTITGTTGNFTNLIGTTGNFTNLAGTLLTPLPITIQDGITKLGILGEALDMGTNDISNVGTITGTTGNFTNLIGTTGNFTNLAGTLLTPLPITIQDGITKLGILGEALDMGTNDISNVGTITGTTGNFTNLIGTTGNFTNLAGTLLTPLPITIQDGITKLGILGEALDMGTNDISNVGNLQVQTTITAIDRIAVGDSIIITDLGVGNPTTTTNSLYNKSGSLYFNGSGLITLNVTSISGKTDITIDQTNYDVYMITLAGDLTLGITGGASNFVVGKHGKIILKTNGTGRELSFLTNDGGYWLFEGGSAPTMSLSDTIDLIEYIPINTTEVLVQYTSNYS
jgi:hypothetical protein